MQAVIDTFEQRVNEIDLYYQALQKMNEMVMNKRISDENKDVFTDDFIKILKSNSILMVYNLVESSIMGGIVTIYDTLKSRNISYYSVCKEIQQIWFDFQFNQIFDPNTNHNSYKDKASKIVDEILNQSTLKLTRKAANISGNLDAKKIRQICKNHGIHFTPPKECRGGSALSQVKDKRNDLAHGTISFMECGRDFSVNDIIKIKDETILFLRSVLGSMKKYYEDGLFLKK